MIVAVLIATVLLQKSEGGGLGMGGGAGFMSSRGTANLLTRTTAILAVGFFVTSLLCPGCELQPPPTSIMAIPPRSRSRRWRDPVAPPTSGGILDSLKKSDEQQIRRRRPGRRRRGRNKAGWPCRTASGALHEQSPSML